ncbi:pantetheine-phosphate adenylyltransferase [Nannocystis pusilla]|uniref:Phosphopantetheine adenylyltransferase n=1 Tax=Nannocystis pusilla TaxID=889268 RepID=A0ABS7TK25_9BACT|nr:pantetheine-phosphate adenylyltransferase [Nannocystis pusilla]
MSAPDPGSSTDLPRPLTAVYAGSFDPITSGHVEIVERALRLFDRVIVAVGRHPTKTGYFSVDERVALIAESIAHLPRARADRYDGLMIDFCSQQGARVIVRGLRAHGDFEPEFQIASANRDLRPEIETVFLIPGPEHQFVSSSLVREIAGHGGDFARYVPAPVAAAMRRRLQRA